MHSPRLRHAVDPRSAHPTAHEIAESWTKDSRWCGVDRCYSSEDVVRLRGSIRIEHTLARMGAEKLWGLLQNKDYVAALGAMSGNQAAQQVQAGLEAIYCSGWQVAADANTSGQMYPDQSLYPCDSVPSLVRKINQALIRADQIQSSEQAPRGEGTDRDQVSDRQENDRVIDWFAPIIADAEAGFGGTLNAFELMKAMIEAGAAAVHFEDQLASAKKCGHMGGKVLVPTSEFIQKLSAARLASDVLDVPTVLIARTDANGAKLITSDSDPYDAPFVSKERTAEGFFRLNGGLDCAIARGLAFAPHADMLWCETSEPDLEEARRFAEAIHSKFPGKVLAYNCSPSFNWKLKLDAKTISRFQTELAAIGYKFQFVTLAGFHALNYSMFDLARDYRERGMDAYSRFQQLEFEAEKRFGYSATRHQRFVGTGYFDEVAQTICGADASTLALHGSTEREQFDRGEMHSVKKSIA